MAKVQLTPVQRYISDYAMRVYGCTRMAAFKRLLREPMGYNGKQFTVLEEHKPFLHGLLARFPDHAQPILNGMIFNGEGITPFREDDRIRIACAVVQHEAVNVMQLLDEGVVIDGVEENNSNELSFT